MACSRSISITEILQYNLFPANTLLDEDYTFKPEKAILVKKFIQRQPLQNMTALEDIIKWLRVQNSGEFNHLDLVFDSYVEKSSKESEIRSRVNYEPFEVINMLVTSKISAQIDQFWASLSNKIAIRKLCWIFLKDVAKSKHLRQVTHWILMAECFEYREDGTTQIREELNNFLENADTQLI